MKLRLMKYHEALPDDTGGGPSPADAKKVIQLAEKVEGALGRFDEQVKQHDKTVEMVQNVKADLERATDTHSQQITELRTYLEHAHGKSGADDWYQSFAKFMMGAHALKKGRRIPDECKVDGLEYEKAAADFTTTTDATAGYLVPSLLMPGIIAGKDIYGTLIPRCYRLTASAGQTISINYESTNPASFWRKTQGTAMSEDEYVYGQASVTPVLVGSYIKAANELVEMPGTGFMENSVKQLLRAIVIKEETGMIQGDDDALGTALDPPSDGFLVNASTTDAGSISADTIAAYVTMLGTMVNANTELLNTGDATLFLSPLKVFALASQVVNATNLPGALTWADPEKGLPGRLMGYPYIPHPAMLYSAAHYAALINCGTDVVYANSGKMSVDFNDQGAGWTSNETWIRVLTHTDWAFPRAAKIQYADYS